MKIQNLFQQDNIYSSNVYLVLGDWNTLKDVNTLIDVGRDPCIIDEIENAATGVGKKRIEQVILTHSHYDHSSLLPIIKNRFHPVVRAYNSNIDHIDQLLSDREKLKIADREFEVIYMPGHSDDSISLYCEEDGVIFVGDAPIIIRTQGASYHPQFIKAIEYLSLKKINIIYFGHGDPKMHKCDEAIQETLKNIT